MIESIGVGDLEELYGCLSFPYLAYRQWQDEDMEPPERFITVASCTAQLHPREEWNRLGREIYESKDVERHAGIVVRLLRDLQLTDFLVQQTVPAAAWFRGKSGEGGRAKVAMAYLKSCGVSADVVGWRGGFVLRDELDGFLRLFLDYPFLLNTYDIEMLSIQRPLALILDHHLCVEYVSPDPELIGLIKARIVAEGVLEYPDRGVIAS